MGTEHKKRPTPLPALYYNLFPFYKKQIVEKRKYTQKMEPTNFHQHKSTANQQPLQSDQQPLQQPLQSDQQPLQQPLFPLQTPVKRFNTVRLSPTPTEKKISKYKANIAALEGSFITTKEKIVLLKYYKSEIKKLQAKIDTAHAYLIEVSSPKYV